MSRRSKSPPQVSGPLTLDDDRVWPVPVFCEVFLHISEDTFNRICAAGEGPPITWLSQNRRGVRGRDGGAWLNSRRAKAEAATANAGGN